MITRKYTSSIDNRYKRIYYSVSVRIAKNNYDDIHIHYTESSIASFDTLNRIDSMYDVYYFETLKKEKMTPNIEELIIEYIHKDIIDIIRSKKRELISIPKGIKSVINRYEKYSNSDIFKQINRKNKLNSL